MTYADETLRNDTELNAAVVAKLIKHRDELVAAMALMNQAYNILSLTDDLHDGWGHEPYYLKAKRNLASDVDRMSWMVNNILSNVGAETSAYAGNIAAFLTPEKADRLKQEYREGKI
jgi:hypothetical protein